MQVNALPFGLVLAKGTVTKSPLSSLGISTRSTPWATPAPSGAGVVLKTNTEIIALDGDRPVMGR